MRVPGARIGRFVRAARSLLLMQLAAAAIALALSVWAVVAVRDLAAERDRLVAEVAALQARQTAPAAPAAPSGPPPSPLDTEVRPPPIVTIPVPVVQIPDVNTALPVEPVDGSEPDVSTPPQQDCTGANANQARCRPGRWRPPAIERPLRPVQPEPQRPAQDEPTPGAV